MSLPEVYPGIWKPVPKKRIKRPKSPPLLYHASYTHPSRCYWFVGPISNASVEDSDSKKDLFTDDDSDSDKSDIRHFSKTPVTITEDPTP